MIDLDQQQEQCLRDLAASINRSRGPVFAMKWLRRTRWIMRAGLTLNRFFAPGSFKRWNDARIAEHQRETGNA